MGICISIYYDVSPFVYYNWFILIHTHVCVHAIVYEYLCIIKVCKFLCKHIIIAS